jgi:hypothetical protein
MILILFYFISLKLQVVNIIIFGGILRILTKGHQMNQRRVIIKILKYLIFFLYKKLILLNYFRIF